MNRGELLRCHRRQEHFHETGALGSAQDGRQVVGDDVVGDGRDILVAGAINLFRDSGVPCQRAGQSQQAGLRGPDGWPECGRRKLPSVSQFVSANDAKRSGSRVMTTWDTAPPVSLPTK